MKNNTQVEHPDYYNKHPSGIECIDIVRHFNFNLGNVIKYVWRAGLKDDNKATQDLKKALFYLQDEINRIENRKEEEVPVRESKDYKAGDIYYIDGKPVGIIICTLSDYKMLVLNLKHHKNMSWDEAQKLYPISCVDGWRLPCKAEANLMMINVHTINKALKSIKYEPFLKNSFWLSSETSDDSAYYGSITSNFLITGILNKKDKINVFSVKVVDRN